MIGYHDYLIVLSPESVSKKVRTLKEHSFSIIGEYNSHYAKAHISVQNWPRNKPVWIEPMLPKLERDLLTLSPLVMDISGFDFFDQQENKTIYAKLRSTPLTEVWFKQLRRYFNRAVFEPHITITRTIPREVFIKLWPYFKDRQWNEQVKIDKLTILRRETIGYDKSYKIFKEIPFNQKLDFFAFANSKIKPAPSLIKRVNEQQFSLF